MEDIKAFFVSLTFFLCLALGGFGLLYVKLTSKPLQESIQVEKIYPGQNKILFINSSLTVADTPLTLKITSIDTSSKRLSIAFFKGKEEVPMDSHIYEVTVTASNYITYANVTLTSVFDDCEQISALPHCSLDVIKRIPNTDQCDIRIGIVAKGVCKDIVRMGSALTLHSLNECSSIQETELRNICSTSVAQ